MKLICTKENLKKGLFVVSRVVGVGNPLQVLNNILIKTDQGRIKLSSTNLEIGVNTWIGGKIEEEGALTVPARLLNEYINNLPTDIVTITSKDTILNLESQNYSTNIRGLSADDFPLIPQVADEPYSKIDSAELKDALSETIWATANNETQPEISGIFFSFEEDKLRIAATDRYRLAERIAILKEPVKDPREVIVPARTINEMYKILNTGRGDVEIYFSESQVLFKFEESELISRLIDGQYPPYKEIIPKEFNSEVTADREEFIHALKAAALFASDSNNIQIQTIPGEGMRVTASSVASGENTTLIKADVVGPENSAIFNYRYVLDCLNNVKEKRITLKMINDATAAMMVPTERDNYIYIVMPIKL